MASEGLPLAPDVAPVQLSPFVLGAVHDGRLAGGFCGLRRCSRVVYHGFELVASDALARDFYCSAMSRDNSCCRRRRRSSSAWFGVPRTTMRLTSFSCSAICRSNILRRLSTL